MQPHHQTQSVFQTPVQQFQLQGMGILFGQSYPPYFQQLGMGGYPISQLHPGMMGGMFTIPSQM